MTTKVPEGANILRGSGISNKNPLEKMPTKTFIKKLDEEKPYIKC